MFRYNEQWYVLTAQYFPRQFQFSKTLAIYGGRSFLTRFIYLTFVSTPLQCFQCFYMSLMFFQPDFWCLMFFCDVLTCFIDLTLFSPAPMFSLFQHRRWNGDKSSQIFPQQTHVETNLLLRYLCCCWEIFRQRFSAAVLPPLLLPQPSHVRPLPWCRSWVTARAPSLPCGVRQIIELNLSSTLFIEALFMLRDNLHNYYNFLGFFC